MPESQDLLSIGQVAEATGLRPSALRYYEDAGLIEPAGRIGGRRHYEPGILRRLAIVALCQEVGFGIAEIADLLGHGEDAADRWREIAERKLTELDAHIERAQATRRVLQTALACGCGDPASCDMVSDAGHRRLLTLTRRPPVASRS